MSKLTNLLSNTKKAIASVTTKQDEEFKLPAYVVIQDVKKRNKANEGLYSEQQLYAGEALLADIEDTYIRSKVYLNYRERFIAIKVSTPKFADKVSLQAAKLDAFCDTHGVVREHTRYGHIVYRANMAALDSIVALGV